jgi:predicted methyltransferase
MSDVDALPATPPAPPAVSDPIEAAVAAPDRSAEDRELDTQRQPGVMLEFFGIAPGMRVAELGAGKGYTTELLARVVGSTGQVYAQNTQFILERFAEGPLSERLAKPVNAPVVRVDTEFDAPFPPDVRDLDAVLNVLFYHDTVWMETDRALMNRAVFEVLRPGGVYGIVDHSAREGDGVSVTKTLHRIEESVVVQEVTAAGFQLADTAAFLRNPEDPRDWSASPGTAGERRGQSDRFVLKFTKPK